MNKFAVTLVIVCGVFATTASQASAQGATWADRGYVNVSFGVESGSSAMSDTRISSIYEETATVTSTSDWTSGAIYDFGVGIRIWKNLTIGGAYHQEKNDTEGSLSGPVPSPVFFNRPRTLTQSVPELERKEQATHLQIGWVVPIGGKFDIMLFGGPSFFRLAQDTVSEVTFVEQGGAFTTVAAREERTTRKKSQTGYNAGLDATYIVWSNDSVRVGAGGFVRFTQADIDVEMLSGAGVPTKAGGVQFGFGARLRF